MAKDARRQDDAPSQKRHAHEPAAKRRSFGIWLGSRLLVVAILLGVLLFFAPLLVTSTGVWKQLLAQAAPELASQVQIEGLELSWLAPIELRGVSVVDPAGQPLAAVPRVKSEKSLLGLALNYRSLGAFTIEEPKLKIVLRRDGSNIEDFLARLPKSEGESQPIGVQLNVVNATVAYEDQVAGRSWLLDGVNLEAATSTDEQIRGKLAAAVRPAAGGSAGQLSASFAWQPAREANDPLGSGEVALDMRSAPTELAEGALMRFAGDIHPRGSFNLRAAAAFSGPGTIKLKLDGLETAGLSVKAPQFLGTDEPTIVVSSAHADLELAGAQATIRSLDLQSNLVRLTGKGQAAGGALTARDVDLTAQLNLAEVARQLGATLHLRDDMQLQSGTVDITLATGAAAGGWRGSLRTRDLRGIAGGRPVEFERPVEVRFAVRQTEQGPVIDDLVGEASFLRVEGRGSLAEGGITANADLDKLVAELGRLIDWGQTQLAGSLASDIRWKREADSGWTASADLRVQNFVLSAPEMMPWKEPQLQVAARVRGVLDGAALTQISGASLTVAAGEDRMEASLTEMVRSPSASSVWPAKFSLQGNLASWTPRLQPFVPLGAWRVAGGIDLSGLARLSTKEVEFSQTNLTLQQLAVDGMGITIREQVVKVETAGAWSQANSTLTLGSTTLASSAIAFRADGVRVIAGPEPSLVGTIDLRGDLARLSSWMGGGGQPAASQMAGGLTGRIEIGYRGQALAANWNADVENFKYLVAKPPAMQGPGPRAAPVSAAAPVWQSAWEEPRVSITGQASYDPATGTLKVERAGAAAAIGSVAATGAVTNLGGATEVDLTGELAYDLALVAEQIKNQARAQARPGGPEIPYGLETLVLTGKQKRQFVLKGPLFAATPMASREGELSGISVSVTTPRAASASGSPGFKISEALVGEASLGWEGAQYVGLVAGPADFRARLAGGIVHVGPLDIPLAEGRLTTAPRILLNDPARSVAIDRGPLLQNVRISPEMCSLWLKFVAPMVADATRAEGKFSLSLEGANVPLTMPLASDVEGTLAIHAAQIGPGPLAEQYLGVIRQVRGLLRGDGGAVPTTGDAAQRGWVVLPEQNVVFNVHNGIVTNRGLTMNVGEATITTEGTVNIETQKMNLVATIPLNENWFRQKDGVFAVLKGQTLKIPIDGTLTQPRLDTRALQNLGTQIASSAVKGVITKQLERGQGALNKELERGQGMLNKELERGQSALQQELSQGLNRLFGPRPPQPTTPQPPAQPR